MNAAAANMCQVERDTACAVACMYFAVLFARQQGKVADTVATRLKATVGVGGLLLGKEGPSDLDQISIDRAKLYLKMATTKQDEVHREFNGRWRPAGSDGHRPDAAFEIADGSFPNHCRA